MSEVKPVHRYKAQTLFSFGGAKIQYFPHGPEVVLATEFDAQRLRADTAEAELVSANADKEAYAQNAIDLRKKVELWKGRTTNLTHAQSAAEQRIAELLIMLRQAWIDECISAADCRKIDAALNPNPEAESHE